MRMLRIIAALLALASGPAFAQTNMAPLGPTSSIAGPASGSGAASLGYVAGRWYLPDGPNNRALAGTAPGSGTIRMYPAFIRQTITIDTLGLRVTTLSAGGNVQAAIYASNPATNYPTGSALVSSGSMSTATATSVNAAVSKQLTPGLYWFATNMDNATSACGSFNVDGEYLAQVLGSSTQSISFAGGQTFVGLQVAQTFGTWPDLTSASFTENATTGGVALVQFHVASAP